MIRNNVLLYELNEVPWHVVDEFVRRRPGSTLAKVLRASSQYTTVIHDDVELEPWRTWPTLHKSVLASDHHSMDLGQDVATFEYENLWDVAESAGLSVGLFGPLQSWPARPMKHGGFYIPDTFSRDSVTYPESLMAFQEFNLEMTSKNTFTSEGPLHRRRALHAGIRASAQGLTVRSAGAIARHLLRERRDKRYAGARPMIQAIPSFDLFWRLHETYNPNLSVFFTNHVAAMMHRYWGDHFRDYQEREGYPADPIYGSFLLEAMAIFDRQLARIVSYAERRPVHLLIASGMGQGPIPYRENNVDSLYVVADPVRLLRRVGAGNAEHGRAMYPRTSLLFADAASAEDSLGKLRSVRTAKGRPLFSEIVRRGRSVSITVDIKLVPDHEDLRLQPGNTTSTSALPARELGITIRSRLGGGNTAHHTREGVLIHYGATAPDAERRSISILDVAPSVLTLLGVAPGEAMQGRVLDL